VRLTDVGDLRLLSLALKSVDGIRLHWRSRARMVGSGRDSGSSPEADFALATRQTRSFQVRSVRRSQGSLRTFKPSNEKRHQGDGGERYHPMRNVGAEKNPVAGQPVVNLIAHGERP
jgi:hypothetical protein